MGKPVLLEVDKQQRLWLVSEESVTVLTAKEFRQLTQTQMAAKGAMTAK